MFKNRNLITLLLCFVMCLFVGCTGEPAPEVEQQVYNTAFHFEETTDTTTQKTTNTTVTTDVTTVEKSNEIVEDSETSKQTQSKENSNTVKSTNKKNIGVIVVNKDKSTKKQNVTVIETSKIATIKPTKSTTKETTTTTLPTETTTLAPLSDDDICCITASGEKYHRQGCRYLNKSCIEIIVKEAKEKEYTPCKVCKP